MQSIKQFNQSLEHDEEFGKKQFPIQIINTPSITQYDQCDDIIIGMIEKRHYVWRIIENRIELIYQIESDVPQNCKIWKQFKTPCILILDDDEIKILDIERQKIINSQKQFLLDTNIFMRYKNVQQFQQTQNLVQSYQNQIEIIRLKDQLILQRFFLQKGILQFLTTTHSQYLSSNNYNIYIRKNKSNKIYRKIKGNINYIKEPYYIEIKNIGYKGYICCVFDIRTMMLILKFQYNEDFKDSLFIPEQKLILILNEYNLLIFSSFSLGLLDVQEIPFDKRSVAEPYRLNYRNNFIEIFCQKYSMNQQYR